MSDALEHVRYSCGIAGEEVANYVDELERVVAADSDLISSLHQQLKSAQGEWNQCSGLLDDSLRSIEMLEDQLATAEQRVAEACAEYVLRADHDDDPYIIAGEIRSGEWRKFVKEKSSVTGRQGCGVDKTDE